MSKLFRKKWIQVVVYLFTAKQFLHLLIQIESSRENTNNNIWFIKGMKIYLHVKEECFEAFLGIN